MSTIPCMNCGTALEVLGGFKKPYCLTEECALVYARWLAHENVEKRGECELWRYNQRSGTSYVFTVKTGPTKFRTLRVLAAREKDISVAHGKVYYNQCGTERCVVLAHHELRRRPTPVPKREDEISARLPAEPLLDYYECSKIRESTTSAQQETLRKARIRGWVTVTTADNFCIDVLKVHPAVVYGDLFWDAA